MSGKVFFFRTAFNSGRRSGIRNDKQNLQTLISYLERKGLTGASYKGYTESATASVSDLKVLMNEMEDYGLYLYNKKWGKETEVDNCTSKEDLDAITW